jgi:hypothetical protein
MAPAQRGGVRRHDSHLGARRPGDEVGHRDVGDDPASSDHDEVIGGVLHLAHQVRGEEHRAPLGGKVLQQGADPHDAVGVQPVHRLVEHDDGRIGQ